MQAVAHEVETLLDHARNVRIMIAPELVDLILSASEYLKEEVEEVQCRLNGGAPPVVREVGALIRRLSEVNGGIVDGALVVKTNRAAQDIVTSDDLFQDRERTANASDEIPSVTCTAIAPRERPAPTGPPTIRQTPRAEGASVWIRVDTAKLDRLMDMVGEMVIAQSMLNNSAGFAAGDLSQLARLTGEVQRCAMGMRMMPIGPLFQKNAKMVRDLSRRNGKQVSLELVGESTELDKTIAEELADPLLHMIRNALDHGIEMPDERLASGKPPVAMLRIAAEHRAGQVVISISDDGRGLDPRRILGKAVERGLVDLQAQLSNDQIFHLIFAPGFSTAEKITDISGRGVGMDVVRQHVEKLRGRIEIESELGKGTTFFIYLPLTLAIIEGLVVGVGAHRYLLPMFSVKEMFQPTEEMLFSVQGRDEMILLRNHLQPIVRLHRRFHIEPHTEKLCEGLLIVCEFAGRAFCLFVDELLGRQEIVIRRLDETFQGVKGLAGSAILADGRIGLILDVDGIFHAGDSGWPEKGLVAA